MGQFQRHCMALPVNDPNQEFGPSVGLSRGIAFDIQQVGSQLKNLAEIGFAETLEIERLVDRV